MCKFLLVLCEQVKLLLDFRSRDGLNPACAGIPFPILNDNDFLRHTSLVKVILNTRVYINGTWVWKFTRRYSEEARAMALSLNIAPKFSIQTVGEWVFVRMQKISGVVVNSQTLCENLELWKNFKQQVGLFHDAGFVHGDMRQQNIMFGCLPQSSFRRRYLVTCYQQ
jgi:hypothetical protein